MWTDTKPSTDYGRRLLQREAARWWWVLLMSGIGWLIIGWLVLRANITSLGTVGVLVGVVFLVAGLSEMALTGIVRGGWRALHITLAVFFLLGALWAFIRPIDTFFALASVLGLLLFLQGGFYIARAAALRDVSPYWWVGLGTGALFIALAIWMSLSDRVWNLGGRTVFILACVGFYAIFRGVSDLGVAFDLRHFGKDLERDHRANGVPHFPAQDRQSASDRESEKTS